MRYWVLLLLLVSAQVFGQGSVSGVIVDSKNVTLPGATVQVLQLPDSVKRGTATDLDGRFSFENLPSGSYTMEVSFIGFSDTTIRLEVNSAPVQLGIIGLKENTKQLKEVLVEEQVTMATQKGDTTQYNAAAFKTNPDATTEDLVSKMPGVQVTDGKVQAQGEDVKQVLVDGKPFFGDDPSAVLKNMPAEVVDKIQIFDQQSEQSKFTGVSDGNTTKTMNIITKQKAKQGYFGKMYGGFGYGIDYRYKAGANINIFNNDRRFSILSQSNNINEQNFSAEDLVGASAGGGGRRGGGGGGWQGGGGSGDFLVNSRNGISKTHALGFNYSDKWGKKKKVDVSGSYFFNWTDNDANTSLTRDYVLPGDSTQIYTENSLNISRNINHRFNFKLDYEIDSLNSIMIRPRFSLQTNNGSSMLTGQTIGNEEALLNSIVNDFSSDLLGISFSNEALYKHKFRKKGRTISFGINNSYGYKDGFSELLSQNNYYIGGQTSDSLNQQSDLLRKNWSVSTNITYTEGIGEKGLLQINYSNSYTPTTSDKETYNYSSADDAYNLLDTSLSNIFNSKYHTEGGGLSYRYQSVKVEFNLGANYQWSQLKNDQDFPYDYNLSRQFHAVLPTAMLRYKFTDKKNLRLHYRTSAVAPSIEQLQDVIDNSNTILLSRGNPNLNQSVQHNLFTRYISTNTEKSTSLFYMIGGSYTQDYIGKSTFIANADSVLSESVTLQRGSQLTTPVNLDGYFSLRTFLTYGIPMKFMKSNFNVNASANYTHTPSLINGEENTANSTSFALGWVISSNISEKVDFTVSSNSSYNFVTNTVNPRANNSYFNQSSRVKFNWIFWKSLFINTDLSHQYYTGLASGASQNYLLWNAAIGMKLFKEKQGEIRLYVFDILKQNNSITRNITETYTEDITTDVLQRYAMLSFTYNLKKFTGGNVAPDSEPKGPPSGFMGPGGPMAP